MSGIAASPVDPLGSAGTAAAHPAAAPARVSAAPMARPPVAAPSVTVPAVVPRVKLLPAAPTLHPDFVQSIVVGGSIAVTQRVELGGRIGPPSFSVVSLVRGAGA